MLPTTTESDELLVTTTVADELLATTTEADEVVPISFEDPPSTVATNTSSTLAVGDISVRLGDRESQGGSQHLHLHQHTHHGPCDGFCGSNRHSP